MLWDRIGARYGVLPSRVGDLNLEELEAALDALVEAERVSYGLAAFPVWLERGKKGMTFPKFLATIGLARNRKDNAKRGRGRGKMTPEQLDALKAQAAQIRAADLKR